MTDNKQVIGGSKNSNINVKRDDINKPSKGKGYRKKNPKYKTFDGNPIG